MKKLLKFLPIVIIIIAMIVAYLFGVTDYLTYEMLQEHRQNILGWVNTHYLIAPLAFMAFYIIVVALSIPGATVLTFLGGFLFGQPGSTIYVVVSATIGAICIFLAAKTAFHTLMAEKAGPFLKKLEKGFNDGAASYMLFLRFIPLFPFWLINIAPAFFNVSLFTYAWTTFVGIIPGSFVYAQAGTGLGAILDNGDELTFGTIFNTQVKIALAALAIFSLVPIIIKKIRSRKKK